MDRIIVLRQRDGYYNEKLKLKKIVISDCDWLAIDSSHHLEIEPREYEKRSLFIISWTKQKEKVVSN